MEHTKKMSAAVLHEPHNQRFMIDVISANIEAKGDGNSVIAELTYRLIGNNIDFNHTYVPFNMRGKGLAELLVKAGLAWAESNEYEISASCSYVNPYLNN
jgi:predicted GNAT family acetyltransferase